MNQIDEQQATTSEFESNLHTPLSCTPTTDTHTLIAPLQCDCFGGVEKRVHRAPSAQGSEHAQVCSELFQLQAPLQLEVQLMLLHLHHAT